MNKDILLCGVGGQGTVLASKLIAAAAMASGNKVSSAETIGMAQRGGSVTSHIRIGENAYSPLIPYGRAELMLAFEPAEAVRNLKFLKKDGFVIVNTIPVKPVTESVNYTGYDGSAAIEYLSKKCRVLCVDAEELCKELGSARYFNCAVLGVAAGTGMLGFSAELVLDEMSKRVVPKFVEINKKAFLAGKQIGEKYAAE